MKYYIKENIVYIRGSFRAASHNQTEGISEVSTIFIRAGPRPVTRETESFENLIYREGLPHNYVGFETEVPITDLCIIKYDFITVFMVAGRYSTGSCSIRPVTIIACSGEGLSDTALIDAFTTVDGAASEAFDETGCREQGNPGDRVLVVTEGLPIHDRADPAGEVGKRLHDCIFFGIPKLFRREHPGERPALYVFSRFGGGHFVEWTPEGCPYYPCHFEGQTCEYCYCPFYPCGDEESGQWVRSSNGGKVWNCSRCTLLHKPEYCRYLKRNPEASLIELKRLKMGEKS